MRHFRLCTQGVDCDANGLTIGGVAVLERTHAPSRPWRSRPKVEIERDLSALYGAPIDIERKVDGLNLVADALTRKDLARAQVATLLLQFPEPSDLVEHPNPALAKELRLSDLLKDDDFEAKHPRTETKPNPGWFATKPKEASQLTSVGRKGWPSAIANKIIRRIYLEFFERSVERPPAEGGAAGRALIALADLTVAVWDALRSERSDEDFGGCRQRIDDQLGAAVQMPMTLEQLQIKPCDNLMGFEEHHIVERNVGNLSKDDVSELTLLLKFGAEIVLNRSNTVWIPRLLHERISAKYSSSVREDRASPIYREILSEEDFYSQRQAGLRALRDFGALK